MMGKRAFVLLLCTSVVLAGMDVGSVLGRTPSTSTGECAGHGAPSGPQKSLSGVPYRRGSAAEGGARRIEFVSVTVDDLALAAEFYGGVLGGVEVPLCKGLPSPFCADDGSVVLFGTELDNAMFEIDRALGVRTPDLTDEGRHVALVKFFVIGNGVIQLIKFVDRESGALFDLREPMTSPVWMGQAHIDLWVEDGVDPDGFVEDVEARAAQRGMANVAFNRPIVQESRADRSKCPKDKYANKVTGSSFDGLAWAYFKGVAGEQLEMYQITRTIKLGIGRAYCQRGAVSAAFVNRGAKAKYSPKSAAAPSPAASLHGLFQYGYRTADLHKAAGFYSEVMGGDLITYPTQGIEIMKDDSAHWMILANETISAYEHAAKTGGDRGRAMRQFGVPNISSTGTNRLDHRFILFDNYVVEPLKYTDGLSFGGDGFDPRYDHASSVAYLGTVVGAFGLDNVDTAEWLRQRTELARQRGFHAARFPGSTAKVDEGHPLGGLEVGYGKGPDGEAIAVVQVHDGTFKELLRLATEEAGGLSTLFPERNPHAQGDMSEFCAYATGTPAYSAYEV